MTISYTAQVSSARGFGFLKLLARWKGSIYKLVWMDLLAFLTIYYALSFVYRFALNDFQKGVFECIVYHCRSYGTLIPLSFVLGFYVSLVMERWWNQYMSIPWPDPIAVFISAHIHGLDERSRVMRRTVMRYVCLCETMVLIMISTSAKRRFPTLDHLVDAGLLLENEKRIIEDMNAAFPKPPKHWMPIVWAASIVTRARKEGRIRDDIAVKTIIDELNTFRGLCGVLLYFDSISIPLVYTQVVTLAVYTYFLCSIMGYQWTDEKNKDGYYNYVDYYFPIFTTLQFFFYMGWLKVAESLINPFGDDDDDFEVNWMIDRNLQVSYLIVDEMHHEHPQLLKDQYWDEMYPSDLGNDDGKRVSSSPIWNFPEVLSAVKVDTPPTTTKDMENILSAEAVNSPASNFGRRISFMDGPLVASRSVFFMQLPPRTSATDDEASTAGPSNQQEPHQADDGASPPPDEDLHESTHSLQTAYPNNDDDFERLRVEREKERLERQRQKLARSFGASNLTIHSQERPDRQEGGEGGERGSSIFRLHSESSQLLGSQISLTSTASKHEAKPK